MSGERKAKGRKKSFPLMVPPSTCGFWVISRSKDASCPFQSNGEEIRARRRAERAQIGGKGLQKRHKRGISLIFPPCARCFQAISRSKDASRSCRSREEEIRAKGRAKGTQRTKKERQNTPKRAFFARKRTSAQPSEAGFDASLTVSGTTAIRSRPASFHLFDG